MRLVTTDADPGHEDQEPVLPPGVQPRAVPWKAPIQLVVDSYKGKPCQVVRPDDAMFRPGEPCGEIHEQCRGHVRSRKPERAGRLGDPCQRTAIPGGVVCTKHGGRSPNVRAAAARVVGLELAKGEVGEILAAAEAQMAGRTPVEAFDDARQRAGAWVLALGHLVGQLAAQSDADVSIVRDDKGAPHVEVRVKHAGLVGPDPSGGLAVHPLVKLYGEWLDRQVRIEKLAADIGLEERRVQLEESRAAGIVQVIRNTLVELGVSFDDGRVARIVAAQLRGMTSPAALEATATEVPAVPPLVPAEAAKSAPDLAPEKSGPPAAAWPWPTT